jgi:hypothetical protein
VIFISDSPLFIEVTHDFLWKKVWALWNIILCFKLTSCYILIINYSCAFKRCNIQWHAHLRFVKGAVTMNTTLRKIVNRGNLTWRLLTLECRNWMLYGRKTLYWGTLNVGSTVCNSHHTPGHLGILKPGTACILLLAVVGHWSRIFMMKPWLVTNKNFVQKESIIAYFCSTSKFIKIALLNECCRHVDRNVTDAYWAESLFIAALVNAWASDLFFGDQTFPFHAGSWWQYYL